MRSARVVGAAERERAQAASDRHDACVKKAEALYKQGEVRQALRQFEAAFVEFGKTTTALRIADLYLQLGDFEKAAERANRVMLSQPAPEHRSTAEGILARCGSHWRDKAAQKTSPAPLPSPPIGDHLQSVFNTSVGAQPPQPPQPAPPVSSSANLVDELFGRPQQTPLPQLGMTQLTRAKAVMCEALPAPSGGSMAASTAITRTGDARREARDAILAWMRAIAARADALAASADAGSLEELRKIQAGLQALSR